MCRQFDPASGHHITPPFRRLFFCLNIPASLTESAENIRPSPVPFQIKKRANAAAMKPNGLKPTSKPPPAFQTASVPVLTDFVFKNVKTASGHTTTDACLFYSELNLNQYSVGSPCRTICTVCGSPPCPDLNLIHYIFLLSL